MSEHVGLFALGLLVLAAGTAGLLVGAARLDRATGRGPFAVGLVAVGIGPCAAGLAFDLAVVLRVPAGPAEPPRAEANRSLASARLRWCALGNVVGGNVASLGLVLGLAALARPLAPTAKLFGTAAPLAGAATLLFWFLTGDKALTRVDGVILLVAGAAALGLLVRAARREPDAGRAAFAGWVPERFPLVAAALLALIGATALVCGAVLAGAEMMRATAALKTRPFVTGSTLAAFGCALPAAVAAVLAARRGRGDLALGLAVGPMVFNLLVVAGIVALVEPLPLTEDVILSAVPAMAVLALVLVPVALTGYRVPRWQGAVLLAAYAGFVTWQFLKQ